MCQIRKKLFPTKFLYHNESIYPCQNKADSKFNLLENTIINKVQYIDPQPETISMDVP